MRQTYKLKVGTSSMIFKSKSWVPQKHIDFITMHTYH